MRKMPHEVSNPKTAAFCGKPSRIDLRVACGFDFNSEKGTQITRVQRAFFDPIRYINRTGALLGSQKVPAS